MDYYSSSGDIWCPPQMLILTTLLMYSLWNVSAPGPGLLLLLTVSGESPLDNLSAILFTAELGIND